MKKTGEPLWLSLSRLSAAFLFLSALLNVNYPSSRFISWQLLQPSVDVWLLLVLLAIAAFCGKGLLFLTRLPVWLLFLVLRLFRIGDNAVPMYFNRPFNLYIDSGYLFGLYDLLKTSSRHGEFLVMSLIAAATALAVILASWYGWKAASNGLRDRRVRLLFLSASTIILCAALTWRWPLIKSPVIVRFGEEIFSIRDQLKKQHAVSVRLEEIARERNSGPVTLKGLAGADVLLFVVESYGQVVFSQPRYRPSMEATLSGFAGVLDQHGFTAVSNYLSSPTFGGASWLAHSSLEFGVRVADHLEEKALLRSSLPPLASYFANSGYRTVSAMPGTRFAFPEGAAYGYQQHYYAWHFQYQGPTFGWAPMSDQFVLDWVRRHEFVNRRQPLFVRYELISSHASFSIQPPFIADWETIGDGSVYNDLQLVYYPIRWPDLKNAADAYLRSLDYEFTVLGDYFARYVSRDSLIIVLGDHQPNRQLTGEDQPWSVPVHVISQNPSLLEPFARRGYTEGLIPDQPLPHAGMETFLEGFVQDFRE